MNRHPTSGTLKGAMNPPPRVFFPYPKSGQRPQRPGRVIRRNNTRLPPRLPQEMVDQVLDQLHDDRAALERCSLVSRPWARSTARHLFDRVRWPKCHHWWADDGAQHAICRCGESDLNILSTVLKSSARIRESLVDLRVSFKKVEIESGRKSVSIMPFYVERLFTLLDIASQLRRLELSGFLDVQTTTTASPAAFQRRGRTLDALVFTRTVMDSEWVTIIVTFFESVSTLTFAEPRSGSAIWKTSRHPFRIQSKTRVNHLEILECAAANTITCLKTLQPFIPPETLKSLELGELCSQNDGLVVETFVRRASGLQSLTFSLALWLHSYEHGLRAYSARRRILAGSQSDWSSIIPILERLGHTHNSLRSVNIEISLKFKLGLEGAAAQRELSQRLHVLDWSLLDNAVASLMYLETLELVFYLPEEVDVVACRTDAMAFFEKRLKSHTRRILRVMMVGRDVVI